MTSAIPMQRSTQLSYEANWELVACEFVIYRIYSNKRRPRLSATLE